MSGLFAMLGFWWVLVFLFSCSVDELSASTFVSVLGNWQAHIAIKAKCAYSKSWMMHMFVACSFFLQSFFFKYTLLNSYDSLERIFTHSRPKKA